jgi:hypothetical protein
MKRPHGLCRGPVQNPDYPALRVTAWSPTINSHNYPVTSLSSRQVSTRNVNVFLAGLVRNNETVAGARDLESPVQGFESGRKPIPPLSLTEHLALLFHVAKQAAEASVFLLRNPEFPGDLSRAQGPIRTPGQVCENSLSLRSFS